MNDIPAAIVCAIVYVLCLLPVAAFAWSMCRMAGRDMPKPPEWD